MVSYWILCEAGFDWAAFSDGYPHMYVWVFEFFGIVTVSIVSDDGNISLEHTLSPSRSKFSSNGGDLGNKPPPSHGSIVFHGNFGCIFDFHDRIRVDIVRNHEAMFRGHCLSSSRSKYSSIDSNFRDKQPTSLMEVSFSFMVILVCFRYLWLESCWCRIRGWKNSPGRSLSSQRRKFSSIDNNFRD